MKGLDGLKVVQVECGGMHTVALTSDGKVRLYMFCMGLITQRTICSSLITVEEWGK